MSFLRFSFAVSFKAIRFSYCMHGCVVLLSNPCARTALAVRMNRDTLATNFLGAIAIFTGQGPGCNWWRFLCALLFIVSLKQKSLEGGA